MIPTYSYAIAIETNLGGSILFCVSLISEIFITIPMSLFFIWPLAYLSNKKDTKKAFWRIFVLRILIYIYFDFCVSAWIFVADYIALLFAWYVLIPKVIKERGENPFDKSNIIKLTKNDGMYEIEDNDATLDEGSELSEDE